MISRDQIRAARALLDWSQPQLAERAGVSTDLISKIENGVTDGSLKTISKIVGVFSREGIVFTQYGVERRDHVLYEIGGKEGWWMDVLEEVYLTLSEDDCKELILLCSDDSVSPPEVNDMYKQIRELGVTFRQLVEEGNTYLVGPLEEYRYIPSNFFLNNVTLIYGNKVAVCVEDNTKAIIFNDHDLMVAWKNIVDLLWDHLRQPKVTSAHGKH